MAKDLFAEDYQCLDEHAVDELHNEAERRPVRWLALESLQKREFTPASDLWMLGITLWELLTLGQTPYANVEPKELEGYLSEGYRLAQPANCSDELYVWKICIP